MTQKEFEDRTGLKVTEDEYHEIEQMYYSVPDMEKDEFCKLWKQTGNNRLTIMLSKRVQKITGMLDERNNELEDCHEKASHLAEFLIGKACAYNDTDFYNEAIRILGQKEVTLRKMRMELPLWEEDMNYIINNLK